MGKYLALSALFWCTSCSIIKEITENMVLVNSPNDLKSKNLEYTINSSNMTAERNMAVPIEPRETNIAKEISVVDKQYFDMKFIPYKSGTNNLKPYMLDYTAPLILKK